MATLPTLGDIITIYIVLSFVHRQFLNKLSGANTLRRKKHSIWGFSFLLAAVSSVFLTCVDLTGKTMRKNNNNRKEAVLGQK